MAQENRPEIYPFIARAVREERNGKSEVFLDRETDYPGRVILHKPRLGDVLPVYVHDRYEEFDRVVPMVELDDETIEDYLDRNVAVLEKIVRENEIEAVHTNHAVLMSVVGERVSERTGVPYSIMPHGSALEYAVKKDARFHRYAVGAFQRASRIFVIGDEIKGRVLETLSEVDGLSDKTVKLHLGVNTSQFEPLAKPARGEAISDLGSLLTGMPRGKTAERSERLVELLEEQPSFDQLKDAIEQTADYPLKSPDASLESKLDSIEWARESTLLFVGRLIAAKGPQNVVATLPVVLRTHPDTRMVIVGHGPLREALEALVWGLSEGRRGFVEELIARADELEEGDEGGFGEIATWYEQLAEQGELDRYFEDAESLMSSDTVVFTGYLTHRELSRLFPCFDVAVFPSLVKEAGPLVFLEALASGVYPLGTYFGGMAASIDAVEARLSSEAVAPMKIESDERRVTASIAELLPQALSVGGRYRDELRELAVEQYDWRSVSATLVDTMQKMVEEAEVRTLREV